MASRTLKTFIERFQLQQTFKISRGSKTEAEVIRVQLKEDGFTGQGECVPYARYGETIESVLGQIEALRQNIESGLSRNNLQDAIVPGAARNALDCALWDLEAKTTGIPVWKLAGLEEPQSLETAYTLSLDTPEAMGVAAKENANRPMLKLKLGGQRDLERLKAVRVSAPNSKIIVDANEGWDAQAWLELQGSLSDLGVSLIEQPLAEGGEAALAKHNHQVPVCADESCHTSNDLDNLTGLYDYINIKLDKTGGLTEALKLKHKAEELGFGIMVGCMVGSSLAMAPAILVGQGVEYVDLDGPLLLAQDRTDKLDYHGSIVCPPKPTLWG